MPSDQLAITLEQYKTARDELLARLPAHYQLIMFKIISVGGIVSFFSSHFFLGDAAVKPIPPMIYYSVWIVPLMSTIFDLLIFRNFRLASLLREFLVTEIQTRLNQVDSSFRMWEQTVREHASDRFFRVPLSQFLIPLFSTLVLGFAVLFRIVHGWTIYDYLLVAAMSAIHVYAWMYLAKSRFWTRPAKEIAAEQTE